MHAKVGKKALERQRLLLAREGLMLDRDKLRLERDKFLKEKGRKWWNIGATATAILVALISLLSAWLVSIWNDFSATNLQEKKFESDLVLKAIESKDKHEVLKMLKFLTDLGLVTRIPISKYESAPDSIPVRPLGPFGQGDTQFLTIPNDPVGSSMLTSMIRERSLCIVFGSDDDALRAVGMMLVNAPTRRNVMLCIQGPGGVSTYSPLPDGSSSASVTVAWVPCAINKQVVLPKDEIPTGMTGNALAMCIPGYVTQWKALAGLMTSEQAIDYWAEFRKPTHLPGAVEIELVPHGARTEK